jgi:hypothetical protein
MSVQLKLEKIAGVRYRQQTQRESTGKGGEKTKIWAFEPGDCQPDLDQRTREPLPSFTVYVSAGLKNLVVEKTGADTTVNFHNSSVRNQLRIRQQSKDKNGKWENVRDEYVPANTFCGVFVGAANRAIVDEMPT